MSYANRLIDESTTPDTALTVQQIITAAVEAVGEVSGGTAGDSAYEVAVANGFVGDEAAWLASLVGADGADGAAGADGVDGADGADGDSAYEIAVANGFVGDEAAWLTSLVGADGSDGAAGADGVDGLDGADGESAYEIAVANGFVGDEAAWLASLHADSAGSVTVIEETAGDGSTYEVQSITVLGAGTYSLEGATLAHDATAEEVETALNGALDSEITAPTIVGVLRNGSYPAGIIAGDLIVAFISADGVTATPAGWTLIGGGNYAKCFAKTAVGTETGAHPTFSTSDIREIYVFRNACTPAALDISGVANYTSVASTFSSISLDNNGGECLLVRHFYNPVENAILANNSAWDQPTNAFRTRTLGTSEALYADGGTYFDAMTARADGADTGNLYTLAVYGATTPAVEVTGTPGSYEVTWNAYGDKPLLGTSDIELLLGGTPGADGDDGVGIADVEIDGSGHLIVTLTDLTEIDAGLLPTGGSEYGGDCGCFTPWVIPAGKFFTGPYRASLAYSSYVANYLLAMPLMIQYTETWTRIGVRCNSSSGNLRMGIFSSTDGLPGDLVLDTGAIAASVGDIEATISQTLSPGLYWLAVTSDAALDFISRYMNYAEGETPWSNLSTQSNAGYLSSYRAFQALPAAAPTMTPIGAGSGPRLWLRKV